MKRKTTLNHHHSRTLFQKLLGTPYGFREEMKWCWRNVTGAGTLNPCRIQSLPQYSHLNKTHSKLRLCFIGDIMDMRRNRLMIGADLKEFARPCDFLIGNFEATITPSTPSRKPRLAAQRQDLSILDSLADLFPPHRTALSIANNHAGDFSSDLLHHSISLMKQRGFQVFGLKQNVFVDFKGQARIAAASMWSNTPFEDIAPFESLDHYALPSALNIAYPHWGFELEHFPRSSTVQEGMRLLQYYDAIIGHHSHVPQPLMSHKIDDTIKLIAFSLGDFCTGLKMRNYRHGIICKMEIGPGNDGVWKIGTVEWRYTEVTPVADKEMKVDLAVNAFV
jgi:hypothetical protein